MMENILKKRMASYFIHNALLSVGLALAGHLTGVGRLQLYHGFCIIAMNTMNILLIKMFLKTISIQCLKSVHNISQNY